MDFKISVEKREKKEKLAKDFMPAVIYGKGTETLSLKLKRNEFEKIFALAGESNLITLKLEGKDIKVLVKDTQKHAINSIIMHVDFYQVNMKEKVIAEIPLRFVGESKAVKTLGGMLNKDIDVLEVECLPSDLVNDIEVDISVLVSFDEAIRVADLKLPAGVVATAEPEEMVASVTEPKVEEEPEPVVAAEKDEVNDVKDVKDSKEAKDGKEAEPKKN